MKPSLALAATALILSLALPFNAHAQFVSLGDSHKFIISNTEVARLTSSTRLGIGTQSPTTALEVTGTISATQISATNIYARNASFTTITLGGTVLSGSGGESTTERQNSMIGAIMASKGAKQALNFIDRWAEGFASTASIDSGSSSNYAVNTTNFYVYPQGSEAQISQGTGTNIGDMTSGGGVSAAFDGTTTQTTSAGSYRAAATGYVGKQWSSAKTITKAIVYSPSNQSFVAGTGTDTCSVILRGSNDGSTWTTLQTVTGGCTPAQVVTLSSPDTTTSYLYHSIQISSAFSWSGLAEVQFFEKPTPSTMTLVVGSSLTAESAPSSISALLDIQPASSITLGTDLTIEVSRNGGSSWTAPGSYSTLRTVGSRKIIEGADISVTGQSTGTSIRARIKMNNSKVINIHGIALKWQ